MFLSVAGSESENDEEVTIDMVQETVEIVVGSGAHKKRVADAAEKVSRERRRRGRFSWRQRVGVRYTWWEMPTWILFGTGRNPQDELLGRER